MDHGTHQPAPAGPTTTTQRTHPPFEQMIDTAVEAFGVIAAEPRLCARLADAETVCALHITDLDRALTVRLDRSPIEVVDGLDPEAESRIWGPAERWLPVFLHGNLGIAVARGELEFEGPVRKFLRVFPIVRTAYRDVATGRESAPLTEEIW